MGLEMSNEVKIIYEKLYNRYGDLFWWPANSPYEVIVGAVLTQNTNWNNVEKAIINFDEKLTPEYILDSEHKDLINIIRPAGFFNQKAAYLKAVTEWFKRYDYDVDTVKNEPMQKIRDELLAVKGIGKETADSILLYAFNFPTFVIDAYTIRLCKRYPINTDMDYDNLKAFFEGNLLKKYEIYNNYHAMIVINGKNHCKKKSECTGCPLEDLCMELR